MTLVLAYENKGKPNNYEDLWEKSEILLGLQAITQDYDKKYMTIKFNCGDILPLR